MRTTDNIFILKSLFDKYCIKNKSKLYVAFIDFKKAYDYIDHNALKLKLLKYGIGGNFYNVIKSKYSEAKARVRMKTLSLREFIKRGVKQGDQLSPLLFNLFINDITREFEGETCHPPTINNLKIGGLLYRIFSKQIKI